jgi:hypothetical protein
LEVIRWRYATSSNDPHRVALRVWSGLDRNFNTTVVSTPLATTPKMFKSNCKPESIETPNEKLDEE